MEEKRRAAKLNLREVSVETLLGRIHTEMTADVEGDVDAMDLENVDVDKNKNDKEEGTEEDVDTTPSQESYNTRKDKEWHPLLNDPVEFKESLYNEDGPTSESMKFGVG